MKILIINTSERVGGAAIAADRLMQAWKNTFSGDRGQTAGMLVRDRQSDRLSVSSIPSSWLLPFKFLWERLVVFLNNGWRRSSVFAVDIANTGTDVTRMKEFQKADVVHLHWVNQAFLSLKDLERIFQSGKRIVITMHDQWYFTGICHYSATCNKYESQCEHCPQLGRPIFGYDMARRVFNRKRSIYQKAHLTFVGCSQWIADLAQRSVLTQGQRVISIPNTIDTERFAPQDKIAARQTNHLPIDRKLLLFSCQRITNEIKGFRYMSEACRILHEQHPDIAAHLGLVVVGGDSDKVREQVAIEVFNVDYVNGEDQMATLYNAVDIFVTPSLQDNLPNTIMEALACGVPCVGFNIGGIPEMIDDRQNGYVAHYRDAEDFANGILWTLDPERYAELAKAARQKVLDCYSEERVAKLYMEIYAKA